MATLQKHDIDGIKAANDIVEVIGEYMTIKRAGSAFKGLCPFHQEKTPSFTVNPQRQSFHCFGCGEGGDVISFLTKHEGVDFTTALRMLAQRAGIPLAFTEESSQRQQEKDVLYRVHEQLAEIYHTYLTRHKNGHEARAYLAAREIDEEAIKSFKIGYAPPGGAVRDFGRRQRYSNEVLEQAGVLVRGSDGYYDRFRERIMFPIHDIIGRVVGFSGRIMDPSKSPAKYMNSPETPLFKKSHILYAMDRARKSMVDRREALICEGQLDAIRCHMAGFTHTVAPQGTALTGDQARILKRYADSVMMLMDADIAGQNAAIRSAEAFLAEGMSVRIATLPEGEDPDSLIRTGGAEALEAVLQRAVSAVEFQVDVLSAREDMKDPAAVMRIGSAVLELIAHSDSAIQREQLIQLAARRLSISPQALQQDLTRHHKPRTPERGPAAPPDRAPERIPAAPQELALIEYLQGFPQTIALTREFLPLPCISDPVCRRLATLLYEEHNPAGLLAITDAGDEEAKRVAASIDNMVEHRTLHPDDDPADAVKHLILHLRAEAMLRERELLCERLKGLTGADKDALNMTCRQLTVHLGALRTARHLHQWDDRITAILDAHGPHEEA